MNMRLLLTFRFFSFLLIMSVALLDIYGRWLLIILIILQLILCSFLQQLHKQLKLIILFIVAVSITVYDISLLMGQTKLNLSAIHQMAEKKLNVSCLIQNLDDVQLLINTIFSFCIQLLELVSLAPAADLCAPWPVESIVEE